MKELRDLARDLRKEAELRIDGGDVEIDKTILEGLGYTGVVDFGGISRWTGTLAGKNE